jgi:hypothetical protein
MAPWVHPSVVPSTVACDAGEYLSPGVPEPIEWAGAGEGSS